MNQGQFIDAVYDNLAAQGFAPASKAQAERGVKAVSYTHLTLPTTERV